MRSPAPALMIMDGLSFVTEICGVLKTIKRTGWVRHGIPLPESDADHMHRCAMCALLVGQPADPRDDYGPQTGAARFHPTAVDHSRLLRMAVTHDVCESLAGDVTPHCNPALVASKEEVEEKSMRKIGEVVGGPLGEELYGLWREYEDQETVEAIYCKDIDKFEMVVQGYEYEKEHLLPRDRIGAQEAAGEGGTGESSKGYKDDFRADVRTEPLRGFFVSTASSMKTPLFRRLDGELRERREMMLKEKGWDVTDAERQKY